MFNEKNFGDTLAEDLMVRKYIRNRLRRAGVSRVEIERTASKIIVNINTARPGIVIGRKGAEVDKLKEELFVGKKVQVKYEEERKGSITDFYFIPA